MGRSVSILINVGKNHNFLCNKLIVELNKYNLQKTSVSAFSWAIGTQT